MKITTLIKIISLINRLKGDIDLYDIREYRGKTILDFKCAFPPYDIRYTSEEVKGCLYGETKKVFAIVNEIYIDENSDPITNTFWIGEDGGILSDS